MGKRYNREHSESQANAEALARRSSPYTAAHDLSVTVQWGQSSHEPKTLKQMARDIRRAYGDAIPSRLHDHDVGDRDESGAPRYASAFAQRLYGSANTVDQGDRDYAPTSRDDRPVVVGYLVRPFDAALDKVVIRDEHAIIWATATGGDPIEATQDVGIPSWCSGLVAYDVLQRFVSRMRSVKLDLVAKSETDAA